MSDAVTFDLPVKAKLMVHPEHGRAWEATDADLERFGYVKRLDTYMRFHDMLLEALGIDDEHKAYDHHDAANSVRYLAECAICYDHSPWADADGKPWPEGDSDTRKVLREVLLGGGD